MPRSPGVTRRVLPTRSGVAGGVGGGAVDAATSRRAGSSARPLAVLLRSVSVGRARASPPRHPHQVAHRAIGPHGPLESGPPGASKPDPSPRKRTGAAHASVRLRDRFPRGRGSCSLAARPERPRARERRLDRAALRARCGESPHHPCSGRLPQVRPSSPDPAAPCRHERAVFKEEGLTGRESEATAHSPGGAGRRTSAWYSRKGKGSPVYRRRRGRPGSSRPGVKAAAENAARARRSGHSYPTCGADGEGRGVGVEVPEVRVPYRARSKDRAFRDLHPQPLRARIAAREGVLDISLLSLNPQPSTLNPSTLTAPPPPPPGTVTTGCFGSSVGGGGKSPSGAHRCRRRAACARPRAHPPRSPSNHPGESEGVERDGKEGVGGST